MEDIYTLQINATMPRIIVVRNRPILTLIFRVMSELAFCNHLNIGELQTF